MNPSPFETPMSNALIRALPGGIISALTVMVAYMLSDASAEFFGRITLLQGAAAFLAYGGVRGLVEGTVDNGSAVQRTADEEKV